MSSQIELSLNNSLLSKIDEYLQSHHEHRHFMGVVTLLSGNKVMFSQGYGMADLEAQIPNTLGTKFKIASVTKQFTAAAILKLQDQGLLDIEKPLSTYLSNYPNSERFTLQHLLTHTAGIPNITSFADYSEWMNQPTTLDQLIDRFQELPLEFKPGTQYRYSNSGYILLTKVIEVVSGKPYAHYLQDNFFDPLGMHDTGYLSPSVDISGLAEGYLFKGDYYQKADIMNMDTAQGAGALYSTTADLGRWNNFLFGNIYQAKQLLSQQAITSMTSPQVSLDVDAVPDLFYGYGLVIDCNSKQLRIGHGGGTNGFTASLMYVPDLDLTAVVLSNVQSVNPEYIVADLISILTDEPYQKPEPLEKFLVSSEKLQFYVGDYQLIPSFNIHIFVENNQLQAQGTGQPAINLYPVSKTEFISFSPELRVRFNTDSDTSIRSLTLFQGGQESVAYKVD